MTKFYVAFGLLLLSPILIPILIIESSINLPIVLYGAVRLKMKRA